MHQSSCHQWEPGSHCYSTAYTIVIPTSVSAAVRGCALQAPKCNYVLSSRLKYGDLQCVGYFKATHTNALLLVRGGDSIMFYITQEMCLIFFSHSLDELSYLMVYSTIINYTLKQHCVLASLHVLAEKKGNLFASVSLHLFTHSPFHPLQQQFHKLKWQIIICPKSTHVKSICKIQLKWSLSRGVMVMSWLVPSPHSERTCFQSTVRGWHLSNSVN